MPVCSPAQFRKWAQAERAMEAHNGATRLPSADMPLVVKHALPPPPPPSYAVSQFICLCQL